MRHNYNNIDKSMHASVCQVTQKKAKREPALAHLVFV